MGVVLDDSIVPTHLISKRRVYITMKIIRARNIGTCKPTPTGTRVQSPTGKVMFTRRNKGTEVFVPRDVALVIAQQLHRGVKSNIKNERLQSILHEDFNTRRFPWKVTLVM